VLFGIKIPNMQIFGVTGESLGTIGSPAEAKEEPEWKKLLTGKPSVSVRRGIARVSRQELCLDTADMFSFVRITLPCLFGGVHLNELEVFCRSSRIKSL
jgi:hypothetical protein